MLEGLLDRVLLGTPPNENRIRGIRLREPDTGLWKSYRCAGCTLGCLIETRGDAPRICYTTAEPAVWYEVE